MLKIAKIVKLLHCSVCLKCLYFDSPTKVSDLSSRIFRYFSKIILFVYIFLNNVHISKINFKISVLTFLSFSRLFLKTHKKIRIKFYLQYNKLIK